MEQRPGNGYHAARNRSNFPENDGVWIVWKGLGNEVESQRTGDGIASFCLKTDDFTGDPYDHDVSFSAKDYRTWRFWVEGDSGGRPGGQLGGSNVVAYVKLAEDSQTLNRRVEALGGWYCWHGGWLRIENLNASLTAGEVYHLVMQNVDYGGASRYYYISPNTLAPFNDLWLNQSDPSVNRERNVLVLDSKYDTWEILGREPVYVLEISDAFEGNPYRIPEEFEVGSNLWHGEQFTLDSSLTVNAIEVFVARSGTPRDDLYVSLVDAGGDGVCG